MRQRLAGLFLQAVLLFCFLVSQGEKHGYPRKRVSVEGEKQKWDPLKEQKAQTPLKETSSWRGFPGFPGSTPFLIPCIPLPEIFRILPGPRSNYVCATVARGFHPKAAVGRGGGVTSKTLGFFPPALQQPAVWGGDLELGLLEMQPLESKWLSGCLKVFAQLHCSWHGCLVF